MDNIKFRIPMPKQTEKVFKDKSKYDRKGINLVAYQGMDELTAEEKKIIKDKVNKEYLKDTTPFDLTEEEIKVFRYTYRIFEKEFEKEITMELDPTRRYTIFDIEKEFMKMIFLEFQLFDYEDKYRMTLKYIQKLMNEKYSMDWLKS